MCIIAYKPIGAKFPTKNQFKTMFKHNPDGCGFMFAHDNNVIIKKGMMTYSEFRQALSDVRQLEKDAPFIFHFRIATHGGVNEAMTQPFPMTNKSNKLRQLDVKTNIGVAHNGIIPLTNDARKMSDTAQFISQYMTRIYDKTRGFDDVTLNIIEACISSKMAILESTGVCHLLGHGWVKDGGLYFSNDSYVDYYKPTKKKSGRAVYGWYDDYYTLSDDNYYQLDDNWCSGDCMSCKYLYSCFGTSASTDAGINSI